jgi:hypothetical protein
MQAFLDILTDKLLLTSEQMDQLMNAFIAVLPKELLVCLPLRAQ